MKFNSYPKWGALISAVVALSAIATGCGVDQGAKELIVITHSSYQFSSKSVDLLQKYKDATGITVKVIRDGDAGEMASKLVLDSTRGDLVIGLDNTFASSVLSAGALTPYLSAATDGDVKKFAVSDALTAIDRGDVCINVDTQWFNKRQQTLPAVIADLTKPEYRDLTVVLDPATSSPGLAFLLTTISKFGDDGWKNYWKKLAANGTRVVAGWDVAYNNEFTAGPGRGERPIVLSYATSPAFAPTTKSLNDGCFAQIEYAGILKGAKNSTGAKKFIDFMLGDEAQGALPELNYVYPIRSSVKLPDDFVRYAPVPTNPLVMDIKTIGSNMKNWQRQWRTVMGR